MRVLQGVYSLFNRFLRTGSNSSKATRPYSDTAARRKMPLQWTLQEDAWLLEQRFVLIVRFCFFVDMLGGGSLLMAESLCRRKFAPVATWTQMVKDYNRLRLAGTAGFAKVRTRIFAWCSALRHGCLPHQAGTYLFASDARSPGIPGFERQSI